MRPKVVTFENSSELLSYYRDRVSEAEFLKLEALVASRAKKPNM